ncbi:MAG: leucine-rich repeat protein, partial [Spirochaetales bacterium]|nr:leucine-rich repeat protein [Spirochaetales bacterium]
MSENFLIKDGVIKKVKLAAAELVIPEGVTAIDKTVFDTQHSILRSIVIPASMKRVSAFAFKDCRKLETVVITEGVESIGS